MPNPSSNPPTLTALAENTVVKTVSNPSTLTALAENEVNTNEDVDRYYRVKKNAARTEVKKINIVREESEKRGIYESKQTRPNRDKKPEIEIRKNAEEKLENLSKQEKYLFGLNESFGQEKDEIEKRLITREQRQDRMILVRNQGGERTGGYQRDIA